MSRVPLPGISVVTPYAMQQKRRKSNRLWRDRILPRIQLAACLTDWLIDWHTVECRTESAQQLGIGGGHALIQNRTKKSKRANRACSINFNEFIRKWVGNCVTEESAARYPHKPVMCSLRQSKAIFSSCSLVLSDFDIVVVNHDDVWELYNRCAVLNGFKWLQWPSNCPSCACSIDEYGAGFVITSKYTDLNVLGRWLCVFLSWYKIINFLFVRS